MVVSVNPRHPHYAHDANSGVPWEGMRCGRLRRMNSCRALCCELEVGRIQLPGSGIWNFLGFWDLDILVSDADTLEELHPFWIQIQIIAQ